MLLATVTEFDGYRDRRRIEASTFPSADFEEGQAHDRQESGTDPEADDDFHFVLSPEEVVIVKGATGNEATTREFEPADLSHDAESFDDENSSDDDEEDFLLRDEASKPDDPTERERTGVPHKDLRGMAVEPEEAERGSDGGTEEDGEFAAAGDEGDLQVVGHSFVSCQITEGEESGTAEEKTASGKSIETIRQIDRIGTAGKDEHSPEEEERAEGDDEIAEGPDETGPCGNLFERRHDVPGRRQREETLGDEFLTRGEAFATGAELDPVVDPPHDPESAGEEDSGLQVAIGKIAPEEDGDQQRDEDEAAPHARGAIFCSVQFVEAGRVASDSLSAMTCEEANGGGRNQERDEKGSEAGERDAGGEKDARVTRGIEFKLFEYGSETVKQKHQHGGRDVLEEEQGGVREGVSAGAGDFSPAPGKSSTVKRLGE